MKYPRRTYELCSRSVYGGFNLVHKQKTHKNIPSTFRRYFLSLASSPQIFRANLDLRLSGTSAVRKF